MCVLGETLDQQLGLGNTNLVSQHLLRAVYFGCLFQSAKFGLLATQSVPGPQLMD
jgi:hypothetical protein